MKLRSHWSSPALVILLAAGIGLGASGCVAKTSIADTDQASWRATALPSDPGATLEGEGKFLNGDPDTFSRNNVAAGSYVMTMSCEGNGKIHYDLSINDSRITGATNACNGNKDVVTVNLPGGRLNVTANSVDAPLIYAFSLASK